MIQLWIEIASQPPAAFYRGDRPASAPVYARPGLLSGGTIRAPLVFGGGGETINAAVSLDNADGDLTGDFSNPPLLAVAEIKYQPAPGDPVQTLIAGQIGSVTIADKIELRIEG